MKHTAALIVAYESIGKLQLPKGITVVGVLPQTAVDVVNGTVQFMIEGPALPLLCEGAELHRFDMDTLGKRLNLAAA